MAYSAYAVANAFVKRAKEGALPRLSPMKLQKLMYFAQAWHLKVLDKPFMDDNFARWQHGPVVPSIYHEFKAFGYTTITREATTLSQDDGQFVMNVPTIPADDSNAWGLIDAVIRKYGEFDGPALSELTHADGSAWALRRGDGSVITPDEIKQDKTIR